MSIKEISRRHFLRGIGGSLIPMPFLSSLSSSAFANTAPDKPNFVSVRSIYGQLPQIFYPERPSEQVSSRAYHRAFSQGEVISPIIGNRFSSVANKISLIQGVDQSWNGHNNSLMLTGSKYDSETDVPRLGTSMDEVLARSSLYSSTPAYRSLRLEPYRQGFGYSWYKGNKQPYNSDMAATLQDLFKNNIATGGSGEADPQVLQALKAVDIAKPGYDKIRNDGKASFEDRARLNDYMDMLNDLEAKLNLMSAGSSCSPPNISTSNKEAVHDAAIDITIAALTCGLTKVVSISLPTWGEEPGENGTSFHEPSHWKYDSSKGSRSRSFGDEHYAVTPGSNGERDLKRMYSYVANKVGDLMSKMDSVVLSNGSTLLDESLVYWGNEQAGGFAHDKYSPPIVIGGTAGGKFVPGHWDFCHRPFYRYANRADIHHPAGSVPYRNFLVTLLTAMGLNRSEWEEVNGGAGFGSFKYQEYPYRSSAGSAREDFIYEGFIENDTAIRKTIPHWFIG